MKLLTEELEKTFSRYPFESQEGMGFDSKLLAHFFNPLGDQHWFITEAEKEGEDWIMFGYADLGFGPDCSEWGYMSLQELQDINLPFGMGIERDTYSHDTVREQVEYDGLEYIDIFADKKEENEYTNEEEER